MGASSEKQQYLAGLANIIPFGHKKLNATDYKDMHEKIMGGEFAKQRDTSMLCSEFVATTIAVSVVELDKQIKEDMRKNKGLMQAGVDLNKDVVQVPFSKHENLHKMYPDRLVSKL